MPNLSMANCAGREYTLRMSAIEIYNEKVRDLLKDGTERQNLPLLDDPERGTVAEGLSEEWPQSEQHLCRLLRQIETRRTVNLMLSCMSCEVITANTVAACPDNLIPRVWSSKLIKCLSSTFTCLHRGTHKQLASVCNSCATTWQSIGTTESLPTDQALLFRVEIV